MSNLSFVVYTGDGGVGPYAVPFDYLEKSHVAVKVDGVLAGFTWQTDASVALDTAAPSGAAIEIRRTTPREPLVDFIDGSILTEADLDATTLQQIYLAQEVTDQVQNSVTLGSDGHFTAGGKRIADLADPTQAQDAVTKSYADSVSGADQAAAAAASASAAQAAELAAAATLTATQAAGAAFPIETDDIADDAVTGVKLADGAVSSTKLAAGAVGFGQMAALSGAGVLGGQAAGAPGLISAATQPELDAGTESGLRALSIANVKSMIETHGSGGLAEVDQTTFSSTASPWTLAAPSGASRILITWGHVQKGSHASSTLRIGDVGGIAAAGYYVYAHGGHWDPGGGHKNRLASARTTSHFWGAGDNPLYYATGWNSGIVELLHAGGNTWICSTRRYSDANNDHSYGHTIGHVTLSGALTTVELGWSSTLLNGNLRAWAA